MESGINDSSYLREIAIANDLRTMMWQEKFMSQYDHSKKMSTKNSKIIFKNCLWQCVIYHSKEETLNINLQKVSAFYYL